MTNILGAASFGYAALSIHSAASAVLLLALAAAWAYGYLARSLRGLWLTLIFCATLLLWCDLFAVWSGGRLLNPNLTATFLALALAAALSLEIWWFLPFAAVGLWWTEFRAALLSAAAVLWIGIWRRAPATAWCAGLIGILFAILAEKSNGESLWRRLGIWQDTINHMTFWGSGWGSFADAYASWPTHLNMTALTPTHAYSDPLELVFELGIGSALVWAWIFSSFEGADQTCKLVLIAFGVLSLTYFPLSYAGPIAALSLGHLARKEKQWHAGASLPRTT